MRVSFAREEPLQAAHRISLLAFCGPYLLGTFKRYNKLLFFPSHRILYPLLEYLLLVLRSKTRLLLCAAREEPLRIPCCAYKNQQGFVSYAKPLSFPSQVALQKPTLFKSSWYFLNKPSWYFSSCFLLKDTWPMLFVSYAQ